MANEQVAMGLAITLVCVAGLFHEQWLLTRTKKGQRLERWLGPVRSLWALRAMLTLGALFGALLASDVIRPVRW